MIEKEGGEEGWKDDEEKKRDRVIHREQRGIEKKN